MTTTVLLSDTPHNFSIITDMLLSKALNERTGDQSSSIGADHALSIVCVEGQRCPVQITLMPRSPEQFAVRINTHLPGNEWCALKVAEWAVPLSFSRVSPFELEFVYPIKPVTELHAFLQWLFA